MSNVVIIKVTNTSGSTKQWGGREYFIAETYQLEEVDRDKLLQDETFITDLIAGDAVVSDAEYDLSVKMGLALIQNNVLAINGHYTLVSDSEVLMGNGEILYLNDDLWEYDSAGLEDNNPTEDF